MRRLFLDLTSSTSTEWNTGVQRVARNLACACLRNGSRFGTNCRAVHLIPRRNRFAPLRRLHEKAGLSPGCRTRPSRSPLNSWAEKWNQRTGKVRFQSGDVLFLPDVCWPYPMIPTLLKAGNRGAVVGWLVYDLIPLRFPGLSEPNNEAVLGRWLPDSFSAIDFFVGISRATEEDLWAYFDERGMRIDRERVGHITLSCGVAQHANSTMPVRPAARTLFGDQRSPLYLSVGTLEPRKNHLFLLHAFDRLWRCDSNVQLVIVGRQGWGGAAIEAQIRAHPEFGRRLWLFTDFNDAELSLAYRRSDALVMTSKAEGFGLPIIEAERDGLHVLASDIPAHREVAGPDCRFFGLSAPQSLADAVSADTGQGPKAERRKPRPGRQALTTWDDSAAELFALCRRMVHLGKRVQA